MKWENDDANVRQEEEKRSKIEEWRFYVNPEIIKKFFFAFSQFSISCIFYRCQNCATCLSYLLIPAIMTYSLDWRNKLTDMRLCWTAYRSHFLPSIFSFGKQKFESFRLLNPQSWVSFEFNSNNYKITHDDVFFWHVKTKSWNWLKVSKEKGMKILPEINFSSLSKSFATEPIRCCFFPHLI